MTSLSFHSTKDDFLIKIQLAGKLPQTNKLPQQDGDKLRGLIFYLSIDENYFSANGKKNPGGPDANIKISLYGSDKEIDDDNKIDVGGTLVSGGPGYDYIVVRYPTQELLHYPDQPDLVITAYALATSEIFPSGVSSSEFTSSLMSATKDNHREVRIKLTPNES